MVTEHRPPPGLHHGEGGSGPAPAVRAAASAAPRPGSRLPGRDGSVHKQLLRQQVPPPPPWPRRWGPTSLPPAPLLHSPHWRRRHPPLAARVGRVVDARVPRPREVTTPSQEPASLQSRATWGPRSPPPAQHCRAVNFCHPVPSRGPHLGPPLRGAGPRIARIPGGDLGAGGISRRPPSPLRVL